MRELVDGSSGDKALELRVINVLERAFLLWKARHKKYGRGNISRHGAVGCLVRCDDKLARLGHFYETRATTSEDESVEDSWLDALNYCAMGLLCEQGKWPGLEHENAQADSPWPPNPAPESAAPDGGTGWTLREHA